MSAQPLQRPSGGSWTSHAAGTLWTSHPSGFLDVHLELNATVKPSFCAMNYLLAESEKTKADGSYWDNSARKKKATSTNRHISPCAAFLLVLIHRVASRCLSLEVINGKLSHFADKDIIQTTARPL